MFNHILLRPMALAVALAALTAACKPTVKKQTAQEDAALAAADATSAAQSAAAAAASAQQSHAFDTSAEVLIIRHPVQVPGVLTQQTKFTAAQAAATRPLSPGAMKAIENARAIRQAPVVPAPISKP